MFQSFSVTAQVTDISVILCYCTGHWHFSHSLLLRRALTFQSFCYCAGHWHFSHSLLLRRSLTFQSFSVTAQVTDISVIICYCAGHCQLSHCQLLRRSLSAQPFSVIAQVSVSSVTLCYCAGHCQFSHSLLLRRSLSAQSLSVIAQVTDSSIILRPSLSEAALQIATLLPSLIVVYVSKYCGIKIFFLFCIFLNACYFVRSCDQAVVLHNNRISRMFINRNFSIPATPIYSARRNTAHTRDRENCKIWPHTLCYLWPNSGINVRILWRWKEKLPPHCVPIHLYNRRMKPNVTMLYDASKLLR
jgi:GH24 family phage-related lysozyme (muramidase)